MTSPAALIERDPKQSGRQIGIASPLPRVCRCTPMLLQQGNACPIPESNDGSSLPQAGSDHRTFIPGF
jgi:hypothetical protein